MKAETIHKQPNIFRSHKKLVLLLIPAVIYIISLVAFSLVIPWVR